MKTKQKFFRLSAALLLALNLIFLATAVQAAGNPVKKTALLQQFAYPGYRVYSTLSTDKSQLTLYLFFETGPGNLIPAPATTTFTVTLVLTAPGGGTTTFEAPFIEGYTTITHPTGLSSFTTGTYSITGVSPTSLNSYGLFYDPTVHTL